MANQKVQGLVTIHRLRTGKTVQLYLDVKGGLYQAVSLSGVCTPDWTVESNRPVITPAVTGAQMSNPRWYKDMPANTPVSGRSAYQVTSGTDYNIDSAGKLKFLKSPVDRNNIHNITYTFICDVSTGGTTEEVQRTIQVICRQGGENSYWGQIMAPEGTTLGRVLNAQSELVDRNSTTLTPALVQGTGDVTNFTVKWYKSGAGAGGTDVEIKDNTSVTGCTLSGKNLIVGRDAVDSMAHFECHFYVNNVLVEAEGIQIADNADEYFINVSGDKNVYTDSNGTVRLVAALYKAGDNSFVQCDTWKAVVSDSERMNEYDLADYHIETGSASGEEHRGVFTMSEAKMYVPNTGDKKEAGKPWLKCGDSAAQDVAVSDIKQATPCDVNVSITAEF